MKLLIFTTLMITLISNDAFSAELPIFTTYNDDEITAQNKTKYDEEMAEWLKFPKVFKKYQVIQIVVPNNNLKAFETVFMNGGKTSRQQCEEKMLEIGKKLDPKLQQYIVMRCLNSSKAIKVPDETSDLELIKTYESKKSVRSVSWGRDVNRINKCDEELKKEKSLNFFSENKKYDFNNSGCLIFTQKIYSDLSKEEPTAKREEKKPWLRKSDPLTAVVLGGVVCKSNKSTKPIFFSENATAAIVGGNPNFPNCYKLKKGSFIHAQKTSSQTYGTKTYPIRFTLKTSNGLLFARGNTPVNNVKFIPKNDGSLFR